MISLLIFLSLFSCAHQKSALPEHARITTKKFPSAKDAKNNLRNRWNYLFLLFEQSHDPYYGTPKWSVACLEKNKQGKLTEDSGNTFFVSQFLLNEKHEPGHCTGASTEVILLHCKNSLNVHEIHCTPGNCASFSPTNLCSSGAY